MREYAQKIREGHKDVLSRSQSPLDSSKWVKPKQIGLAPNLTQIHEVPETGLSNYEMSVVREQDRSIKLNP